jgi:hypothetical protein
MAFHLDDKIEGKVTLGPPILMSGGPVIQATTPEELKAFDETLGKLFGINLKGSATARPNYCCATGTNDYARGECRVDDICCC